MSKQSSIASFFKPKNAKVEEPPVDRPIKKKPLGLSNKENENEKIEKLLVKSENMTLDSDEDDIMPKRRRNKGLDSSDEEPELKKPAKKKSKREIKKPNKKPPKNLIISDSDSDDEDDEDFDEKSSAESESDVDEDMADELAWLQTDQNDDEKEIMKTKSKKDLREATKKTKKKKGLLIVPAEDSDDSCPFSDPGSFSPQPQKVKKPKAEKKSPKTDKVKSPKKEIKSPKKAKASPKKEAKSPKKEPKSEARSRSSSPSGKSPSKSPVRIPEVKEGDYNPTKSNYHAIKDACWKAGEPVPYSALTQTLKCCEETSGRLNKTEYLGNFYRSVLHLNEDDLVTAIHMSLNLLAATYEGVELGIGDMVLIKSISQATGRPNAKIKADLQSVGDLGIIAENSKGSQKMMFKPKPLKMTQVYEKLQKIAKVSGTGGQNTKVEMIKGLLVACQGSEARFLIRSCSGKLRVGVSEATVLASLSRAIVFHEDKKMNTEKFKVVDEIIKTAYCELPNYNILIKAVIEHGSKNLADHVSLQPGVPLKPMLAHPTKAISEILSRFGAGAEFTAEYKYDGERAQIHILEDGTMKVYSRNQEDNTSKYPDVIKRMPNCVNNVTSAVIDSESVAWDPEQKLILPFQVLTTRKRKDVDEKDIKVQVCIHAFDLLYLNGESLVKKSLRERRDLLWKHFKSIEGEFVFATAKDMSEIDDLQVFLDQAVKDSTEGLMVKALEDSYEISKRSHSWLKLKKDYIGSGVADSVDVLVMGGYYGKGKRSGNYGGFLLGVYDADNEEYQTVCKLGTGLTDENLKLFTERLEKIKCAQKSYYRLGKVTADVYFEPEIVWEIKCADLSISPVHTAGTGLADPSKGISLRFPRFIRERDDKTPEMATSADQIFDMYSSQDVIINAAARSGGPK